MDKVEVIHGNGHDQAAGVPMGGNGPRHVDQMHDLASQDVAEGIGVVRQDHFHHLGL
jgi:hypothetical protein